MSEEIVKVDNIIFGYKTRKILDEISLSLQRGEILGVIGPNGSGKSTLIKLISGFLSPWQGKVILKGLPVSSHSRREIARMVASVSQGAGVDFPFTVREIISMGRTPYLGRFAIEGKRDKEVIEEVMYLTGVSAYAGRYPSQLSGGEGQRVMIARALAQEPEVLLLDEPTSHLDLKHQIEINRIVMRMKREKGLGVIYVTHDLNIASQCCDRILMLKDGIIHSEGIPSDVINAGNIEAVYGCKAEVDRHPGMDTPRVTPLLEVADG